MGSWDSGKNSTEGNGENGGFYLLNSDICLSLFAFLKGCIQALKAGGGLKRDSTVDNKKGCSINSYLCSLCLLL
jgi:hypothetical protein